LYKASINMLFPPPDMRYPQFPKKWISTADSRSVISFSSYAVSVKTYAFNPSEIASFLSYPLPIAKFCAAIMANSKKENVVTNNTNLCFMIILSIPLNIPVRYLLFITHAAGTSPDRKVRL